MTLIMIPTRSLPSDNAMYSSTYRTRYPVVGGDYDQFPQYIRRVFPLSTFSPSRLLGEKAVVVCISEFETLYRRGQEAPSAMDHQSDFEYLVEPVGHTA